MHNTHRQSTDVVDILWVRCPFPLPLFSLLFPAGKQLTIKRLLLRNMSLSPAATPSANPGPVPKLLPLGLVPGVPSKLSLVDVRLAVNDQDFIDYLALFQRQLPTHGSAVDTGARMHTVSATGMHLVFIQLWQHRRLPCTPFGSTEDCQAVPC